MNQPSVWGIHDDSGEGDGSPSGCGWHRIKLPFDALGDNGWKVGYQAGNPKVDLDAYKIIVGERLDRYDSLAPWRRLRLNHRLVYELDDDIWNVRVTNWQAFGVYRRADIQDAVEHCCAVADLVTVSTPPLAERVRRFNSNVVVCENRIPEWPTKIERKRSPGMTVGWFGGASHAEDLAMISPVVRRFLYEHKGWQLHIMGTDFRPTFGLSQTRLTDWIRDPGFYHEMDFDIGLAPLTNDRFNECKSNLKALQYAALGIPVIASDTPPYHDFVKDGVTGFLVRSRPQWRARLNELAADEGLRESMGAKARELAAEWTIERNWQVWDKVYRTLL